MIFLVLVLWMRTTASLPEGLGNYDVVLASDVLYERPYGPLVAEVIARVLAPAGIAVVADPGRVGRESFVASLAGLGLGIRSQYDVAYVDGAIRQTIGCLEVHWARDGTLDLAAQQTHG